MVISFLESSFSEVMQILIIYWKPIQTLGTTKEWSICFYAEFSNCLLKRRVLYEKHGVSIESIQSNSRKATASFISQNDSAFQLVNVNLNANSFEFKFYTDASCEQEYLNPFDRDWFSNKFEKSSLVLVPILNS